VKEPLYVWYFRPVRINAALKVTVLADGMQVNYNDDDDDDEVDDGVRAVNIFQAVCTHSGPIKRSYRNAEEFSQFIL